MSESNKELVRTFFEGLFGGDVSQFERYLAEDYVDHSPFAAEAAGPEGLRRRMEMLEASLAVRLTLHDLVGDGDFVAFRWTMEGEHVGEFAGIPPTGRRVTLSGLNLERLEGGKIVEHWSEYDRLALVDQISDM